MPAEEQRALAARFYHDVINGGDPAALEALIAPDYVDHGAPGLPPGPAGLRQLLGVVVATFPDIAVTVEDLIVEGDRVAARLTVRGTLRGSFRGFAPTGQPVSYGGMDILRLAGGRVAERWSVRDFLGMLHQAGALPG